MLVPGLISFVEILTKPNEFEIKIRKDKKSKKYYYEICRSPNLKFKKILFSDPFFENPADAIGEVRKILELVQKRGEKDLKDPESFISLFLKFALQEGKVIDPSDFLNPKMIDMIVGELDLHRTY